MSVKSVRVQMGEHGPAADKHMVFLKDRMPLQDKEQNWDRGE